MEKYAELEISLHRRAEGEYAVEFRYNQPDSAVDVRLGEQGRTQLDLVMLRAQSFDPRSYALSLTDCFFSDPQIKNQFARARSSAEALTLPLRVRLLIGPTAPELHTVSWEQLLDPEDHTPLFTGEKMVFSRYLSSLNLRPVKLTPKAALRALVFIASPDDLDKYHLAPIDTDKEFERARQGLGAIPATCFGNGPATLNNLIQTLRSEKPDILYLVCHGGLLRNEPYLWLEDATGQSAATQAKELVTRLKELSEPPLLVVLASCDSAVAGPDGEAKVALGPRLAEAGIPAVVAMQGSVSMPTVAEFMPVFFRELGRDGQIDRAMALARGAVRDRGDYWMPVLFTRLKSGSIYAPAAERKPRTWRFWAAAAAAVLFLLGAGVGAYVLATRPPSLDGGFNVVVAMFTEVDAKGHERVTENSRRLSALLYEEISLEKQSLNQLQQFDLLPPDKAGPIKGRDRDKALRKLADQTQASLIIFGRLVVTDQGYSITPEFYVSDQATFKPGAEITGVDRLGKDISLGPVFDLAAVDSDPRVKIRMRALRRIMNGLAYLSTANYPQAELEFEDAANDTAWADDEGKEVAYLLLGGVQLMPYDPRTNAGVLSKAQASFTTANNLNKNYPRPYLGLAQIAYLNANAAQDPGEQARLIAYAEEQYQMALDRSFPGSLYATKATYGLGVTAMIRVEKALPGWTPKDAETASTCFEAVIEAYEKDHDPGLTWYAAHTHAHLARIAGWYEKWGEMAVQAREAIALLRTLPGSQPLIWIARYWEYVGLAEKNNYKTAAALNAYRQAIEAGEKAGASAEELKRWQDAFDTLEKGNP